MVIDGAPPPDIRVALQSSMDPAVFSDGALDIAPQVEFRMRIFRLHGRYSVPGCPDVFEYREQL